MLAGAAGLPVFGWGVGQLCYPAVDVVALSSERVDAGPSTPGVPGLDIAEVGPPGMTPESDEEGGR